MGIGQYEGTCGGNGWPNGVDLATRQGDVGGFDDPFDFVFEQNRSFIQDIELI